MTCKIIVGLSVSISKDSIRTCVVTVDTGKHFIITTERLLVKRQHKLRS